MKVIKEGKKIEAKMRVVCETCKAELEINPNDINSYSMMRDEGSTSYYFTCPCCHRDNIMEYDDFTEEMIFELFDNK